MSFTLGGGGATTSGLPRQQAAVWRAAAEIISETGLSPSYAVIAKRAGGSKDSTAQFGKILEERGFWRREGSRRSMTLHIVRWPEGITPRETTGRADGGPRIGKAAPCGVAPAPAPANSAGLTDAETDVWVFIAKHISENGQSPRNMVIGRDTGHHHESISVALKQLESLGYIERRGKKSSMTIHVLRWPSDVLPRETEARTNQGATVEAIPATEQVIAGDGMVRQRRCLAVNCNIVFETADLNELLCPACTKAGVDVPDPDYASAGSSLGDTL